jgi:hypothetical protein
MIDAPPDPLPAQEQVIERKLLDCGLKAGAFTVMYEDELQSIEVVIRPPAGAGPEQFPCIFEAVWPEIVTFEDQATTERYDSYVSEQLRDKILADAQAGLKERGLLAGFPDRSRYTSFADYIRALEVHAGFAPGSVLQLDGDDRVTIVFQDSTGPAETSYERFATLFAVLKFASTSGEFKLGFVGNEKVRE